MKKTITSKEMVDFLNDLLTYDKRAVENLFNIRVFCNEKLSEHETVQCGCREKNVYTVGFIGILNGMFGIDDDSWGCISMDIKQGKLKRFRLLEPNTKGKEFISK